MVDQVNRLVTLLVSVFQDYRLGYPNALSANAEPLGKHDVFEIGDEVAGDHLFFEILGESERISIALESSGAIQWPAAIKKINAARREYLWSREI